MIGNLDPKSKNVTVIGAGVSGLIIAYTLKKKGFSVKVLEASSRIGGLIETRVSPGYGISEDAAHSLLVTPEIKEFFDELKIDLLSVNPKSKARYIYRNKKMRRMPLTFFELIFTLVRFFSKPKAVLDSETATLADWCNAYLGTPALRYLLSPFVAGIFASSPNELHAKVVFPKLIPTHSGISLFRWLKQGKKSTRPQMMTLENGMGELISRLGDHLKNEINLNHPVHSLDEIEGNIIFSVPASELAKLISKQDPLSAQRLLQIRYAPLVTATCFYKISSFRKVPPKGVGVLIPRGEDLRILGCLFNSSSFQNRVSRPDLTSLTVMIGGSMDPQAVHLSEIDLNDLIDRELKTLLGTTEPPERIQIKKWDRAIPTYSSDLYLAQNSLRNGFCASPGKLIFTNYSKEVSIRSIISAAQYI